MRVNYMVVPGTAHRHRDGRNYRQLFWRQFPVYFMIRYLKLLTHLMFCFTFCETQSFTMWFRLALNSQSSCLRLLGAGMASITHHAQQPI